MSHFGIALRSTSVAATREAKRSETTCSSKKLPRLGNRLFETKACLPARKLPTLLLADAYDARIHRSNGRSRERQRCARGNCNAAVQRRLRCFDLRRSCGNEGHWSTVTVPRAVPSSTHVYFILFLRSRCGAVRFACRRASEGKLHR